MTAPRPLGYWVSAVYQLLEEQYEQAAHDTGLGQREWQVLNRLRTGAVADDFLRQALAPFLGAEGDLDDAVRRLDGEGLLEHQGPEYRLTDKGVHRVDEVRESAVQRIRDRAALSQQEYDGLVGVLERVARNLGWQPA